MFFSSFLMLELFRDVVNGMGQKPGDKIKTTWSDTTRNTNPVMTRSLQSAVFKLGTETTGKEFLVVRTGEDK